MKSLDGILGLTIGDAMGVPLEFCMREKLMENPTTEMIGYGSHDVPKGSWSDDTSMTIATIDSINNKGKIDYDDIATNFLKWFKEAKYTPTDRVFDIGRTSLRAIARFETSRNNAVECGGESEMDNGNGSLMRILPIAYYCFAKNKNDKEILDIVSKVSSITHKHEISIIGCYIYVLYAIKLLEGKTKEQAYEYIKSYDYNMFSKEYVNRYNRILKENISEYSLEEIKSTGFVVDTLEATLWVLLNTNLYSQAIIGAINLGNDTDTVGACVGGLAGIIYGIEEFPEQWKKDLLKYDYIYELCNMFDKVLFEGEK